MNTEPKLPEPVYSVFVRGNRQETTPYVPAWTLKDGVHALVTDAAAQAYAEALAEARVAQERERWRVRVEQAYREGYWARETYNDAEVSDVDEKWARAKAGLLGPNQQPPETGKEQT